MSRTTPARRQAAESSPPGGLPRAGSSNLSSGMGLPLFSGLTIPIVSVNQLHASATNESGVFAGVGRERHRWGASCIFHAHLRPLPPRSCLLHLRLVGDEVSVLLSEVFVHL